MNMKTALEILNEDENLLLSEENYDRNEFHYRRIILTDKGKMINILSETRNTDKDTVSSFNWVVCSYTALSTALKTAEKFYKENEINY